MKKYLVSVTGVLRVEKVMVVTFIMALISVLIATPKDIGCYNFWKTFSRRWNSKYRMDKGYDYPDIRELVKDYGYTAHIRSRGEET
jgi:hypothetical protein